MKRLFCLIVFVICALASLPVFAHFDIDIARLNTVLNHHQFDRFLLVKGYTDYLHYGLFEDVLFADCCYTVDESLIITLYFNNNPTDQSTQNKIEGKVKAAQEICRVIPLLCQDFIGVHIGRDINNIKLIVKNGSVVNDSENTIFIWENGRVEYLPRFFDDSL